ncbi:hypothetical protein KUTeg_006301 [Tegillarca granosa]|uniref:Uncharacterized protein n=1 Tax=Tegillarca granosa TaxID=220873 RepID=A0ABQ9FK21_TEGGR|nr:hypothetical protein KUTeg_006301 [Tegillarca granosa]
MVDFLRIQHKIKNCKMGVKEFLLKIKNCEMVVKEFLIHDVLTVFDNLFCGTLVVKLRSLSSFLKGKHPMFNISILDSFKLSQTQYRLIYFFNYWPDVWREERELKKA